MESNGLTLKLAHAPNFETISSNVPRIVVQINSDNRVRPSLGGLSVFKSFLSGKTLKVVTVSAKANNRFSKADNL